MMGRLYPNADDNLRDPDGYVAAWNGDFVHIVWLHPHSADHRRRCSIDSVDPGAQSSVMQWQGD